MFFPLFEIWSLFVNKENQGVSELPESTDLPSIMNKNSSLFVNKENQGVSELPESTDLPSIMNKNSLILKKRKSFR